MIGAILNLSALEEFHSILSEMFLSFPENQEEIAYLRHWDNFLQRLKTAALAAETYRNRDVIWMKISNVLFRGSGLEDGIIHSLKCIGDDKVFTLEAPSGTNDKITCLRFIEQVHEIVSDL